MRLTNLAASAAVALILTGCTNETLDTVDKADVDLRTVKSKTAYELSGKIVDRMRELNMPRTSPIMLRILKEEGLLEVWKADSANRFQKLRQYAICAWSGKLGPKVKEGDRQAPEGFYPLAPGQMNPNSSYYLAINTGFPNAYDRANGRFGTNLMIHGACSSSGCYSMTDEQMQEIFALARDAFKGGQKTIQLQALPFRMTAENMARHKDNPNYEFWKNLKTGYDQFEITKRPPDVGFCEKKYVFNQQGGAMNPASTCPADMSTPPALSAALAAYNRKYDEDYAKALNKFKGMAWYEPSEAERKAVVAKTREGKDLAYAPTGSSLAAGKLMSTAELEKKESLRAEIEDARKAAEIQKAELDKISKTGRRLPVPAANPLPRPELPATMTASAQPPAKTGSLFASLFRRAAPQEAPADPEITDVPADPSTQVTASTPAHSATGARHEPSTTAPAPASASAVKSGRSTGSPSTKPPVPAANPAEVATAPQPGDAPAEKPKRPFWKIWDN
ncbi:hypothetical protein BJF92_05890 [Rhizobium rhizosphaerae]|uniref:L,D-TPase catalytic domain-containing protein n=1 Tax=Xaviernesmea rhizosphaerae TaxID=1672749 RepID=A0A1Q9AFD3_9HYPH|nr:L,D-transpeptidase family protein [Xaviernesmea rhizosphaerae]OLP53679.1 hypothetical protein BJF92_05890 [Xaviernesmea rhizosphaerae]